jgi:hypothetical protein
VFQSRIDKYDLRVELQAGRVETWAATRHRSAMRPGDVVFFWLAGAEDVRGIYGWGLIKRFPQQRGETTYEVDVQVEQVFVQPLLASTIRRVPELRDLLILRAPQATNFLLAPQEAARLVDEIRKAGEKPPEQSIGSTPRSPRAGVQRPSRTGVFISYSHADEQWLRRLQVHLAPLERDGGFEFWDDTKIRPGEQWSKEISAALRRAKAAVLIVSADFLASRFIMEKELPSLLAAASDEGAIVLNVVASPCRYLETSALSGFQAVNPPNRPLSLMSAHEREEVFYRVSIAVEAALARAHTGYD